MKEEVVHWFAGSTRENHGGRGSQTLRIEATATGGDRRPATVTKMPRDGLARGLEVEAALAAEAAWELKEVVASMDGSLNMDADSTLDLSIELGGDGSISADKHCSIP
ncbi:uncharacterized protein LOC120654756 isoform X1 [Panicum virgatum]|uniref:Uncharacterized protein n=1 Tax=Panicum virgatum TaxID=38727 RepID=A0A8T0WL59_PANVG|nr:uncharacterized protein LOC120654756 isoform X1 [Panicum virgatum]KAG2648760.1 hypothetical protein PVAP13_1NG063250 [Panicum virgatum]